MISSSAAVLIWFKKTLDVRFSFIENINSPVLISFDVATRANYSQHKKIEMGEKIREKCLCLLTVGVVIFIYLETRRQEKLLGNLNHRRRCLGIIITLTVWQGTSLLLQEVRGGERKVHVALLIISLCKC